MSSQIPTSTTVLHHNQVDPTRSSLSIPKLAKHAVLPPLPSTFDARDKWQGCLSDPPTQGTCGSCWAFAAVTTLQDRFCIASCAPAATSAAWAHLDSTVHLCSNDPHTYNAKNENQLYNIADQLFALKKVTVRLSFFQIKTGYGKNVDPSLWASTVPCDQVAGVLPQITLQEWITYFQQAYRDMKQGSSPQQRTRGLTNIALMELGAPLGFYLPLSDQDTEAVALQKMKIYFQFWDTNKNNVIDLCEFETKKERGPMQLSVQKLIVCLVTNETMPLSDTSAIQANAACGGAALTEAWRYLRDSGTPIERCVGYTFQQWGEQPSPTSVSQSHDVLPMCSELLGPNRNHCPGFVSPQEWDQLMHLIVTGKERLEQETESQQQVDIQELSKKLLELEPWNQPLLMMFRALTAYTVAAEEGQIQIEILQNGPVTTGFTLYHDFLYSFAANEGGRGGQRFSASANERASANGGGNGKASALGSTATSLIYKWDGVSASTGTAHAVVIVGWGTYQDIPFWIIRNSWGTQWGTSGDTHGPNGLPSSTQGGGYFWIHRGTNECNLEANVVAGLPDLAGDAFPGTVVQPDPQYIEARITELPSGYNCVYPKAVGNSELVCQHLGHHGAATDYETIDNKLVPVDVTSPLAFFWPDTPQARTKRQALYKQIDSYIHKNNQLSQLKQEFDTMFPKEKPLFAKLLEKQNQGPGPGGSPSAQEQQGDPESNLFVALLAVLTGLGVVTVLLLLLGSKKIKAV